MNLYTIHNTKGRDRTGLRQCRHLRFLISFGDFFGDNIFIFKNYLDSIKGN